MKRNQTILLVILLFVFSITLMSCSKSDSDNRPTNTTRSTSFVSVTTEPSRSTTVPSGEIDSTVTSTSTSDTYITTTNKATTVTMPTTTKATTTAKPTHTTVTTQSSSTTIPTTTETEYEKQLKPFTDAEIADLKRYYYEVGGNKQTGPCYSFVVNSISKTSAQIDITYVGYNYAFIYEASNITVPLHFKNGDQTILIGDFTWTDSWGNSGIGTLTFEKMLYVIPDVTLNVKVTDDVGDWNRSTLDTHGDKFFYGDYDGN